MLGVAFMALLFTLPLFAQNGLSEAEMSSATSSYSLGKDGLPNGDLVDAPYRLLQKLSITVFGLSVYSIKLPSIIIGLILGLLLILLLNRWFKSNVSLLASCLIIMSTPFLFLAGNGTPLIMLVFWPTLLLWIGSKIQGEKRPKPMYCFMFAIAMLGSIFTPYMIYFAVFCVLFVLAQPHLRFIVKRLPKLPLVMIGIIVVAGFAALGISIYNHPEAVSELLLGVGFRAENFWGNIAAGLAPVFSWHHNLESVFLAPLVSLPTFALALIGLFSTTKGFFASRNSIASILIVFCLIITGFQPQAVVFAILPFAILVAHGIKYLLEKWYGLFPENPYARVSALIPLTVLFGFMIIPGLLQYVYGYRYNPNIANEFSDNLAVIQANLSDEQLLVKDNYEFYKILSAKSDIRVVDNVEDKGKVAVLGRWDDRPEGYELSRIITSPMRNNSDIIYVYRYILTEGE